MNKTAMQDRELLDSELELVSGGETAANSDLRAAADMLNVLMGITTTLMNSLGAQLQNTVRQA